MTAQRLVTVSGRLRREEPGSAPEEAGPPGYGRGREGPRGQGEDASEPTPGKPLLCGSWSARQGLPVLSGDDGNVRLLPGWRGRGEVAGECGLVISLFLEHL